MPGPRSLLTAAVLAAAATLARGAQEPAPAAWQVNSLLQATAGEQHWGSDLGHDTLDSSALEARLDASWNADGWQAVLRPRLRGVHTQAALQDPPAPRDASLTEAYAGVDLSDRWRVVAGKRYLAWGPGLLYSPSNRLFPDNGSATPRQEIDGKRMLLASGMAGDGLQLSALLADPYLADTPGTDRGGAFALVRAEHVATAEGDWGWGAVAGGGGGLRPYVGGHLQRTLGDALTLALEAAASRGYAQQLPGWPGLAQDRARWTGDLAVSARYGLSDGGELAAEFVANGYRLNDAEASQPAIAVLPASAATQQRYVARHPLTDGRYLMLQANLPRLFGRSRWTLFLRHLEALDRHARLSFAELGYSPTDHLTLYVGATATAGSPAAPLVRALDRAAYASAELSF